MEVVFILLGIAVLIGGGFFFFLLRSKYEQGKSDARIEDQREEDEAKQKANEVLAEHRDPSDVDRRLRDGSF